jgi:hypothetical protein
MVQRIPSKPDYLSQADFDYIVARDKRQCVYYGACPHAVDGSACCDEALDFDHEQPVELGGDNTFGNIRLLCSSVNRGRKVEPTKKWVETNHWDNPVSPGKLRQIQALAGWDAIGDLKYLIEQPSHLRRLLLGSTTFLPGATGIGKCVLCQSVFFKINELIGRGFPRVKNVLWLTNDTTLRDTGRSEIATDACDIGFVNARPSVHSAKEFGDISVGPNGSDVKVSAIQALWKVETEEGPRRSDTEIRVALSGYDTIVFDECDWANDQVRRIAQLGSHALQISLTASPKITDETFLARFVLIGPGAIADYARARGLDQCLKFLGEVTIAAPHEKYTERERGALQRRPGRMEPDHVLFRSAISQAVRHADQEETRMRLASPEEYFSPHIMVRMSRVIDVRTMRDDLCEQLKTMYDRGEIKNRGWDVSIIFQGHERYVSREERDLAARDKNKELIHPFMLACNGRNKGRAVSGSKRILIMCNIGVRGINNWTISHIVDCTDTMAQAELIQFNWGRPLRWRLREHWIKEEEALAEFATVYNFIPQSAFENEKREALLAAKEFVQNMLPLIGGAGFLTWEELLRGRRVNDEDVRIDITNRPLTDIEKFQIQKSVSDAIAAMGGAPQPGLAQLAIDHSPYNRSPERLRDKMVAYGQELMDKPEFRKNELAAAALIAEFKLRPANVMEKLEPQERYDVADLKRWVLNDPDYEDIKTEYLDELDKGNRIAIHGVSQRLRDTQIANYRPPAHIRRLQGSKEMYGDDWGVLPEIAAELYGKLRASNQHCSIGEVNKAINGAANFIFQISADTGGPMDHPAYHIAILGRYREKIQRLARSKLIERGQLGEPIKRFGET